MSKTFCKHAAALLKGDASRLVDGFFVGGFWWAVLAAIVYSIISSAISSLVMKDDVRR